MKKKWKYKIEEWAEKAIQRARLRKEIVTCRCGETPGGTKHIGNFNDNIRSYFIYLAVKERNYPARHVQTRDNMDPFRRLPDGFFDLRRKWHLASRELIERYNKYVGAPLYFIPDPLGCCKNYSEHFRKIYESECREMGLKDTQYFSTYELYKSGKFNPYLRKIFKKIKIASKIDASIEKSKPNDYVPVWAICEGCKKITGKITGINLKKETVDYVCSDRNLTTKYRAVGCGYKSTIDWKNGNTKMDWEFEWPAQMLIFRTTIEPFGKEHYIGSWPFAKQVITNVYEEELPLVFFYEYFLIDKKKMATRYGNVIPISNLRKVLEPEVIRFIYTKRPNKQRNLELSRILNYVNEFDWAEKIYFGLKKARNEKEETKIKKNYEYAYLKNPPSKFPNRLSYWTIAHIIQTFPKERWKEIVKRRINNGDICYSMKRLALVENWLKNFAPACFREKTEK